MDLGDLSYWDRPEEARAAYQEAIVAGHLDALIDLAMVLRRLGDDNAARAALQRAADCGDADLGPKALFEMGRYLWPGDADLAAALFERVIDTGHPRWAGEAMLALAGIRRRDGAQDLAEALYRKVVEIGDPDTSADASRTLGHLLEDRADLAGAVANGCRTRVPSDQPHCGNTLRVGTRPA